MRDAILALFRRTFGSEPDSVSSVAPHGSRRSYCRLAGGPHGTVIGGFGPDRDENRAFLSFTRTFFDLNLPVPALYADDEGAGVWLVEDLGDTTLFRALDAARSEVGGTTATGSPGRSASFPEHILPAYERVVEILPQFQIEGGERIDFSVAYPRASFDEQSIRWDLNYFKYHFLKLAEIPFNEQKLEDDFARLTEVLLEAETGHFLYRDFQSRNILLKDEAPRFIDYQGGRRGAFQYDIASLLYDAKAAIPGTVREHLLDRYLGVLVDRRQVDRDRFLELFPAFVLIRILQAMGSYGYRGFFQGKSLFLESVPFAARNLRALFETGISVRLPELEAAVTRISERWPDVDPIAFGSTEDLTVRISSFSYRGGYPMGEGEHGGGFVFDCRSLPNPGRQEAFASSTGRDDDVAAFLEATSEVGPFWDRAWKLVESHAANFANRRFEEMSVAFGCTGGQHRSVYFAERLARALRERFPRIRISVEHREESRWPGSTD